MTKEIHEQLNEPMTRQGLFRALGIKPDDHSIYLSTQANASHVALTGLYNFLGIYYIENDFGTKMLFEPADDEFLASLEGVNVNYYRLSKISKTGAVIDSLKGVKNRAMTLQPEVILVDIAQNEFNGILKSSADNYVRDIEHNTDTYNNFWNKQTNLLKRLGISKDEAINITSSIAGVEVNLNSGNLIKAMEIFKLDPHLATLYFGHKTAELLAGYSPKGEMMNIFQMIVSRNLEIAPEDLEPTDFITRTEWANTLNLFRDSVFSVTHPRAFTLANNVAAQKVSQYDPLTRSFNFMNSYDISVFNLTSLNTLSQNPSTWIEQRPKGLLRSIQKATLKHQDELSEVFRIHPEVPITTVSTMDWGTSGLEALLGVEKRNNNEEELLQTITRKMEDQGDDLAFKAFLPNNSFDQVIDEVCRHQEAKGLIRKAYKSNRIVLSRIDDGLELGDITSETYHKIWKEMNLTFENPAIYLMAYFKTHTPTTGKGFTSSIHLAPYSEDIILSSWNARLPYTYI